MRSERSYYLGPYADARCRQEPVKKTVESCPNSACGAHRNILRGSKFCSHCGTQIGPVEIELTEDAVSHADLTESLKEALYCRTWQQAGVHAWLVNVFRTGQPRPMHLDNLGGRGGALALDEAELVAREVSWFTQAFAAELEQLRAAYGADAVTVRWGLVWAWE